MKLSAAHDSSGSEHPDVRGQINEEEVRMPSSTPPRLWRRQRYRRPITSNAWRSKCQRSLRFTARAQILWASMFWPWTWGLRTARRKCSGSVLRLEPDRPGGAF